MRIVESNNIISYHNYCSFFPVKCTLHIVTFPTAEEFQNFFPFPHRYGVL